MGEAVRSQEWSGWILLGPQHILVVEAFIGAETAVVFVCLSALVGIYYAHSLCLGYVRESDEIILIGKYEKRDKQIVSRGHKQCMSSEKTSLKLREKKGNENGYKTQIPKYFSFT
jgi:hypothetical protein